MGQLFDQIDTSLEAFIRSQQMFFVASAPLSASGHVNVSPKGRDTLRILGPRSLAYLDYVGSGAETIAHVRENGRIVVMLCAFQGPPRIVRLYGTGRVLEPQDAEFKEVFALFPPEPSGRAIIHIAVTRVADSCGYGVPLYSFEGDRSQLPAWSARKGAEGLEQYQREKNRVSIDGLPALRWTKSESELQLVEPASSDDWLEARRLLQEYASSLDFDLCFQDFAHELETLTAEYGPPAGHFILARWGDRFVGCGALRPFAASACEMKRLYVAPSHRGKGVGQAVARALIDRARQIGYTTMLLDTLPSMQAAQRIYAGLGFIPTTAYRVNPVPGATFLKLQL